MNFRKQGSLPSEKPEARSWIEDPSRVRRTKAFFIRDRSVVKRRVSVVVDERDEKSRDHRQWNKGQRSSGILARRSRNFDSRSSPLYPRVSARYACGRVSASSCVCSSVHARLVFQARRFAVVVCCSCQDPTSGWPWPRQSASRLSRSAPTVNHVPKAFRDSSLRFRFEQVYAPRTLLYKLWN